MADIEALVATLDPATLADAADHLNALSGSPTPEWEKPLWRQIRQMPSDYWPTVTVQCGKLGFEIPNSDRDRLGPYLSIMLLRCRQQQWDEAECERVGLKRNGKYLTEAEHLALAKENGLGQ